MANLPLPITPPRNGVPEGTGLQAAGPSPIRLLGRKLVFENSVLRVYADHVTGGRQEVTDFLTVIPRCVTEQLVIGIAVLPVKAGTIGLLQVYRHAIGRWRWEVPKGFIDAGESLEEAGARELQEETGFAYPANRLIDLGAVAPEPGVVASRVQLYLARLAPGDQPLPREPEMGHGAMAFFDRGEVAEMLRSNQIEDGCTQAIFLRYLLQSPDTP